MATEKYSYVVRWEINIEHASSPRDAAEQARALQADPDTWCQTFTVVDSVNETSTTIDLANVDAKLSGGTRERRETRYMDPFTYADIEALPYFAVIEGKQGRCSRGGVRGADWELFECVSYDQEVCDHLCIELGISLTDEQPQRIDDSAREGYNDLAAALDYLNAGGKLCKVPDTMEPDCASWALYVAR